MLCLVPRKYERRKKLKINFKLIVIILTFIYIYIYIYIYEDQIIKPMVGMEEKCYFEFKGITHIIKPTKLGTEQPNKDRQMHDFT